MAEKKHSRRVEINLTSTAYRIYVFLKKENVLLKELGSFAIQIPELCHFT